MKYLYNIFDNNFIGPYGSSNNYHNQQPNMQVPNDLIMKLMEAQQVNGMMECYFSKYPKDFFIKKKIK